MWNQSEQGEDEGRRKSELTCHSCRRRKVKCDRELPGCHVCEDTGQVCEYPSRSMKPGPKIGSLQRQKRRCKDSSRAKSNDGQMQSTSPTRRDSDGNGTDVVGDSDGDQAVALDLPSAGSSARRLSSTVLMASDKGSQPRRSSQLNIHDFSFILHPSHDASTPDKDEVVIDNVDALASENQHARQQACYNLGLSDQSVAKIIQMYFDHMVAINLFHEPTFLEGLQKISSSSQLSALLAAITGYAIRFLPLENPGTSETEPSLGQLESRTSDFFLGKALHYIDQVLSECDDDAPPLVVLQALIITTHCQLTQGVRRKAWRSLGLCVRLAYELNFHLLDSGYTIKQHGDNIRRWREDEEKRRAWWAIWEMDVFASTIRRTPTAVSWTQMEVLLPMPDENWHCNRPIRSCFFEQDPTQRWRTLQECGNESPKAWYIVINSLMKESQIISCPRGVPFVGENNQQRRSNEGKESDPDSVEESRQKLEALDNSVHCLVRTLPDKLRYRQQYLGFDARVPGQVESARQLHCSIYNIYVMTQLTRLMIHRYDVFGGHSQPGTNGKRDFSTFQDEENSALRQYFEAADNILNIVNRCSESHVQYTNPFLSSTIWLAAAVQLVRMAFGGASTRKALVKTRFNVLHLAYKQSVMFWDTQTAMQENLESLEAQLDAGLLASGKPNMASTSATKGAQAQFGRKHSQVSNGLTISGQFQPDGHNSNVGERPTTDNIFLDKDGQVQNETQHVAHESMPPLRFPDTPPPSVLGDKPATDMVTVQPLPSKAIDASSSTGFGYLKSPPQQQAYSAMAEAEQLNPMADMSMLDFMQTPGRLSQDMSDMDALRMPASTTDSMWTGFDIPGDIHDLLSGFSTY